MAIIHKDGRAAAELFLRREPSKLGVAAMQALIGDEKMLYFTPAPTGVMAYADHMARTGQLKTKLARWQDAFFDNVHSLPGH
jgi:NitT/TauT family transport system substrate-binding protein